MLTEWPYPEPRLHVDGAQRSDHAKCYLNKKNVDTSSDMVERAYGFVTVQDVKHTNKGKYGNV